MKGQDIKPKNFVTIKDTESFLTLTSLILQSLYISFNFLQVSLFYFQKVVIVTNIFHITHLNLDILAFSFLYNSSPWDNIE